MAQTDEDKGKPPPKKPPVVPPTTNPGMPGMVTPTKTTAPAPKTTAPKTTAPKTNPGQPGMVTPPRGNGGGGGGGGGNGGGGKTAGTPPMRKVNEPLKPKKTNQSFTPAPAPAQDWRTRPAIDVVKDIVAKFKSPGPYTLRPQPPKPLPYYATHGQRGGNQSFAAPPNAANTPTSWQAKPMQDVLNDLWYAQGAAQPEGGGYNPVATLQKNWQIVQNLQRLMGQGAAQPAVSAPSNPLGFLQKFFPASATTVPDSVAFNTGSVQPGVAPVSPLPASVPAPRVYPGAQPMPGTGFQPAGGYNLPPAAPAPMPGANPNEGAERLSSTYTAPRAPVQTSLAAANGPAPYTPITYSSEQARGVPSAYSGAPVTGTFAPTAPGVPTAGDPTARYGGPPPTATRSAPPGGGLPRGVDPVWYNQFKAEHNGQTPEEFYWYSDDPLGQALWDKAWGDQFLAGNYRAPGEEDWKNTAGMRAGMFNRGQNIYGQGGMGGYGGGGGGGGGGTGTNALPQLYNAGFNLAFGVPIETYYTPERGGMEQAQKDYYALHDMYQNAMGRPVDPGEWERIWNDMLCNKAGRSNQAAPLAMTDIYDYANRMNTRQPKPPQISPLSISNQ